MKWHSGMDQEPITRRSIELVELAFQTSYLRCEAFFPYKAVHVTPTVVGDK